VIATPEFLRPLILQDVRNYLPTHWCFTTQENLFFAWSMNLFGGVIASDLTAASKSLVTGGITNLCDSLDLHYRYMQLSVKDKVNGELEDKQSEDFLRVYHLAPFFLLWLAFLGVASMRFLYEEEFPRKLCLQIKSYLFAVRHRIRLSCAFCSKRFRKL